MNEERKIFYPTINDLKNTDCFDFDKWEWEIRSSISGVYKKRSYSVNYILDILLDGLSMRYFLKKTLITHEFIMTSGEWWEVYQNVWKRVTAYYEKRYLLSGSDMNLSWFQTAKHYKCPPE